MRGYTPNSYGWRGIIRDALPDVYLPVWNAAFKYQDARDDAGHGEVVVSFALKLSETVITNEEVVVLAAILHDIGWSTLTYSQRVLIFDKSASREAKLQMRYRHQEKGMKLAREILIELGYRKELITEVTEIISEHDTREGFISANEGLMRDADKLWRFCEYGYLDDRKNSAITHAEHLRSLEEYFQQKNFFYHQTAKELAREMWHDLYSKYAERSD